ncbi:MAG: glycosyltransferase family 4 protein [Candidatus Scalinduaceae bacterium]
MNILIINYEYPPFGGGGGVFCKSLAEQLCKNNNVSVITSKFNNQKSYEIDNNVEIFRVPIFMRGDKNAATIISMLSFFPACLLVGYRLQRKRKFDIVHSMFAIPSAPAGLILAKKFKIPHILSILGGDIFDPSKKLSPHRTPFLHYTVKKMIEDSDKVVALSSDIMKRAIDYYNISKKIDIIHLGIEKPVCNIKKRQDYGFKLNDILLVTVGRLVSRKSVQDLINVVKSINCPNLKLVIIGDGPEKPKLESLSKKLNVSDRIFFFGNVTDEEKFQLLNISDIYVSSSQHEGFGIVFLEAMASGLPVVSYNKGGQVDFLIDNKTGFLIQTGDINKFTSCIRDLSENLELRMQMSQFNNIYVENYLIEACTIKYNLLYELACQSLNCHK